MKSRSPSDDNLRQMAWAAFDRDEFDAAERLFRRLMERGPIEPEALQALVEILIDRQRLSEAVAVVDRALEQWEADDEAEPIIPWLTFQFDLITRGQSDPDERRGRALQVLEVLAGSGDVGAWSTVATDERLAAIEASFESPLDRLEAYEQEAYAPEETGLPFRAKALIEEIGQVHAGDHRVARSAERLLHALGETEAAYRVEHARRALTDPGRATREPQPVEQAVELHGLVVALAGGHPALRVMIERDLLRLGAARVAAIPSATEAVRSGRDVQALLAGVDVVVLLVRQIAHSTSDQVRKAAEKAVVPVVIADSAGLSGVRRALDGLRRGSPPA